MACRPKSEICVKSPDGSCTEPFELDPSLNLTIIDGPFNGLENCNAGCTGARCLIEWDPGNIGVEELKVYICNDNVESPGCSGPDPAAPDLFVSCDFYPGQTCADISCSPPAPGRCCQVTAGGDYIGPGEFVVGNPGLADPANWSIVQSRCVDNLYPGPDPNANCTPGLLADGTNGIVVSAEFTENASCDPSLGYAGGCPE